ncbi:MAG: peptidylprolyl isomerase [Pseudomonadota bacterium]|nr:peptidylprolyl isomerase [Pseudomonadota bacterium]MEC7245748.1 peptidylprolyl isomerase [Pseudomonadota bacterium]
MKFAPLMTIAKKCLPVLVLAGGLVIAAPVPNAFSQERILVAKLNGEDIYLDEVLRLVEKLPEEIRQQPLETYFDRLIDDIVDSRLAAAAGNEAGLTNDERVIEQMSIAAQRVLAEAWINSELRKSITDEAVQQAYDIFVADEQSRHEVRARHILVKEKAEAEAVIAELQGGADFAELAKKRSTGPSGPNGGDLGYFPRGAMVPAFENAAFALKAGSFTQTPVQTQFGWHIILVEEKRIAEAPTIEELAPQLRQNLISQNLGRLLDSLRTNARIERRPFADIRLEAQASSAN